jgi:FtsP/CotA-like multicopper oxidase with cupredoxin domain
MVNTQLLCRGLPAILLVMLSLPAAAQSFRVQCPQTTPTHNKPAPLPVAGKEPNPVGGQIKCQQIGGGDGYATMADGTQTYMFSFGPLSGLGKIVKGLPGTDVVSDFNVVSPGLLTADSTATPPPLPTWNGAVGLSPDPDATFTQFGTTRACTGVSPASATTPASCITGHVDPRQVMDVGVMNGNIPAPLMAIDEDDEFFLTLTNVGMIMRPDLFEQHTVHFHGYPNASSFYDGVPDASVAINIGGSFTYYYLAPDAGTYFWHCHITPPEHLQMGMVGQIYVRPRQNRVPVGSSLRAPLVAQLTDPNSQRIRSDCVNDILCTSPVPAANTVVQTVDPLTKNPTLYAYNDGDGSTAYDVEYPIQIHGFDPNFHFVGMTFNPEPFTDMKDKYFLLNGRSYPDTVNPNPIYTQVADGSNHYAQPLPAIVNIPAGGKALLRISDLDVTEFQTLASLGIPMKVIAINARLLRDQTGANMYYNTNSVTLGGGESVDVILDATDTTTYMKGNVYYLYTPNLDHLSNDAENFGGLMTEVHII